MIYSIDVFQLDLLSDRLDLRSTLKNNRHFPRACRQYLGNLSDLGGQLDALLGADSPKQSVVLYTSATGEA